MTIVNNLAEIAIDSSIYWDNISIDVIILVERNSYNNFIEGDKFTTKPTLHMAVTNKTMTKQNIAVWKTTKSYSNGLKTKDSCKFSYCDPTYDTMSNRLSAYLGIGTLCDSSLVFQDDILYVEGLLRRKLGLWYLKLNHHHQRMACHGSLY